MSNKYHQKSSLVLKNKHIEVILHFIQDYIEKDNIILEFVSLHFQLANIFAKQLVKDQFDFI